MANYIRLILAETDDGSPVVAAAPLGTSASRGDIVSINSGALVTVQEDTLMDPESTEYVILSAVSVIHEAEAVYRQCWRREEPDDADTP